MLIAAVLSTSAYFFKWAETLFNGPICFILFLTSVALPIVAVRVQKKHIYSRMVFVWTILLFLIPVVSLTNENLFFSVYMALAALLSGLGFGH